MNEVIKILVLEDSAGWSAFTPDGQLAAKGNSRAEAIGTLIIENQGSFEIDVQEIFFK